MRAAAAAVADAYKPAPNIARDFYFTVSRSASGWDLTVWNIPPGTMPAPGGFVGVHLSADFTPGWIVGGA